MYICKVTQDIKPKIYKDNEKLTFALITVGIFLANTGFIEHVYLFCLNKMMCRSTSQ